MNSKIVHHIFFLLVIGTFAASQSAPTPVSPAEGETVHVLVGKSIVINVQAPLTRVLSSNPTAVETMATSPTQVVVEGKAAGNSSLILWDASGRSQILDVAVDLDISGLRSAIQRSYPNEQLDVEGDAGRLVLTGTASNAHIVEDVARWRELTRVKSSTRFTYRWLTNARWCSRSNLRKSIGRTVATGANWFTPRIGHTTEPLARANLEGPGYLPVLRPPRPWEPRRQLPSRQHLRHSISPIPELFLFNSDINLGVAIQALQARDVLEILADRM